MIVGARGGAWYNIGNCGSVTLVIKNIIYTITIPN